MILNLFGVAFAIAAIVLYSIDIALIGLWWMCDDDDYSFQYNTPSPDEKIIMEKCLEGKALVLVSVENVVSAVQKVVTMSVKKRALFILQKVLKVTTYRLIYQEPLKIS